MRFKQSIRNDLNMNRVIVYHQNITVYRHNPVLFTKL